MPSLSSWKVCAFIVGFAIAIDALVVQWPLVWVGIIGILAVGTQFLNPIRGLAVVVFSCGLLSYSPFESGALSRLYPGDVAIVLFLIACYRKDTSRSVRQFFKPNVINRPLLGIAVITVLSMLWSRLRPDPAVTYNFPHADVSWNTAQVAQLVLLGVTVCVPFAVSATVKTWTEIEAVVITLGVVVAVGTAVTIAALIFGFGGTFEILGATRGYWEQPWASSMEPLASLLLPFLFAAALFGRHSFSRYWSVCVLFVFCLLGVALTFSRESWLLAFLGMLLVSGLWLKRRITSIASLLMVALLALAILASGAVGVVSRFYNPNEVYGYERMYFYITALQLFLTHPFLGVGAGNYQFFDRTYADVSAGGVAHNQFLGIAAETGVFGLLMFLWLVIALLRFVGSSRSRREHLGTLPHWIKVAGWAFVIVWIVECLFREAFFVTAAAGGGTKAITSTIFPWILLGLLFAASNLSQTTVGTDY